MEDAERRVLVRGFSSKGRAYLVTKSTPGPRQNFEYSEGKTFYRRNPIGLMQRYVN